jgi:acyl-coenzyme A thioesterase 9
MVCRDAFTHKARDINPLQIETAEDKALNTIGESHRTKRQSLALRSLSRVPPTQAEAEVLHKLHLEYGKVRLDETMLQHGEERVWMGDTKLEVSQVMFPQDRK